MSSRLLLQPLPMLPPIIIITIGTSIAPTTSYTTTSIASYETLTAYTTTATTAYNPTTAHTTLFLALSIQLPLLVPLPLFATQPIATPTTAPTMKSSSLGVPMT